MIEHSATGGRPAAVARLRLAFLILFCGGLATSASGQAAATAHQPHEHGHEHSAPRAPGMTRVTPLPDRPGAITLGPTQVVISDVTVVDQDGRRARLYSDLMKDKVIVLSFFFTSCKEVCPMQGVALAKLQRRLGERLGREVFLISITKDPETDTPERLKEWGQSFGVRPGWTLLTGEKDVINKLVFDITGERPGASSHLPLLLIGNDKTGRWAQALTMARTEELTAQIDDLARPDQRQQR